MPDSSSNLHDVWKTWDALCFTFWTRFHCSLFIYKGRGKKGFIVLLKSGNLSGVMKKGNYKLTSSVGKVFFKHFVYKPKMKSTSLKFSSWHISGQSKVKWRDLLISWDAEFLFWTLENFHNMKCIKVTIYSVLHAAPLAWKSLPLTLDQIIFYSSKVSA